MKYIRCFVKLCVAFALSSCQHNSLDIDVSGIQMAPVEVKRLDKDLFEAPPDSIVANTPGMIKKYGSFYPLFVARIINDGGIHDSSYAYSLKTFLADKDMREAYQEGVKTYPDLTFLNQELTDAFKHYHYYFPQKNIPQVIAYMSGFNYSIATNDSTLGIGLEMYLGDNNKFYQMIQFPNYKTLTMKKEYIVPDAIKGWLLSNFENDMSKNDFLSEIIYYGKIMYLMDAIMPAYNDTLKMGYTGKQLYWCQKNEFNMWSYFIKNKMLYSTENGEIMKFTHEGPFTSAFSKESPARTGHWMGWQIVRAYMNKNENSTLQQLMDEKDAQKILTQSKYKPNN